MTSKLEIFKAELEALEATDGYDAPQYDWLVEQVERLQVEERTAKPSASPAPATSGHPEPDLASRMLAMQRNPERYSDAKHEAIVAEFNQEVMAAISADQPQPQAVDLAALQRDMLTASADPNALTDQQRSELMARYNVAIRQGDQRTTEELRAELASPDLPTRMLAAAALHDRGQLDDATADQVVDAYNAEVHAAGERGLNVAELPEELRPAAEAILKATADLETPPDPVAAAIAMFNRAVRSMRPATLAEQLEALGVDPDPALGIPAEPQSQEA